MKIREIEAKTILVRSKLPDADYVVNPYSMSRVSAGIRQPHGHEGTHAV